MKSLMMKTYLLFLDSEISTTGIEDIDNPLNTIFDIMIKLLRTGGIIFFVISLLMFLMALGDQDAHGKKTWGLAMIGSIAAAAIGAIVSLVFGI